MVNFIFLIRKKSFMIEKILNIDSVYFLCLEINDRSKSDFTELLIYDQNFQTE